MRSAHRLPGLDGLRALAVLAVVLFHGDPSALPGGFLGVDVFFVLSGFLITRQLLAGGTLRDFWLRRAKRLLPPLLAVLVVVTAFAALVWRDELPRLRGDLPAALLYGSNWQAIFSHVSYFEAAGRPSPVQHLWSLAVEEQFYLVWPLVVLLFRRRLRAVALGLAAASTAWMAWGAVQADVPWGNDGSRLYFGTDTHAAGLLVGAALAAGWTRRAATRWSDGLGVAALAGLVWAFFGVSEFSPKLYRGGFLLVAVGAAVVVAALVRRDSRLAALLDLPPLRWLGTRSYAIYLWHWPVDVVTRPGVDVSWPGPVVMLVRLAVPLALAELSWRVIEHPSRRTVQRRARAAVLPWRPVMLPAALACVLVVSLTPARAAAHSEEPEAPTPAAASGPAGAAARPGGPSAARSTGTTGAAGADGATPAPRRRLPPGGVLAVGDSVLLGAEPDLEAAVPHLTVDAEVGRQARPTFALLAHEVAAHHPASVVLVLGNNGVVDPKDLSAALKKLRGLRVVLVVPRVPRDWQDLNRSVLSHARGVTLADWYAASAGHRAWFADDGYHLTVAGAAAYTRLIVAALSQQGPQ